MIMITPAEFEDEMRKLSNDFDQEHKHRKADELMCEILNQFGYSVGVEIFNNMNKWYS